MEKTTTFEASIPFQMNHRAYAAELASAFNQANHGDTRNAFTTLAKGTVDFFAKAGYTHEEMADGVVKIMEMEANRIEEERKISTFQCKRSYSMISTQRKASEIWEFVNIMNNFLLCHEIILCDLEQKYAYRILDLLKEKGLYKHLLKKHANQLRELTGMLQMRIRNSDKMATQRSCSLVMNSQRYVDRMFEEAGGIGHKLQQAFIRMFDVKLKLIRMDSRELSKAINLKHTDLMSEIFTLLAITETAIEVFEFCAKQIRIAGRGRLIDHSIKSTHHESVRNAVRGLIDQFVSRNSDMPEEEMLRARQHVKDMQADLAKDEMFEMFNAQYMALRIDYIEFYLASVRMEIENGTVSRGLIREVWKRLGSKQATKSFFKQLAKMPIPTDEDATIVDVARVMEEWDGQVKTVDQFRRLCAEGTFAEPTKETDEEFRHRVLRTVARKFKGQLPDDVLSTVVRLHKTKKSVIEQLEQAGFELAPTIHRVKRMKASELKKL
jgi:hypothetical protein